MQVYTYIYLVLTLIGFGVSVGERNDKDVFYSFLGIIAALPIIGRVLGWW